MPHLQLRDVPSGVHDRVRSRAAAAGISMREYLLRLIEADLGTADAWSTTLVELEAAAVEVRPNAPAGASLVADARGEREHQLGRRGA